MTMKPRSWLVGSDILTRRDDACRVMWWAGMLSADEAKPIRCLAGELLQAAKAQEIYGTTVQRPHLCSTDFPSQEGVSDCFRDDHTSARQHGWAGEVYQDEHKLRWTYRSWVDRLSRTPWHRPSHELPRA